MKFSEAWLREWVNPALDSRQLAEQLTMAGLEVDAIEPVAAEFRDVVVAEVLSVEPHPDADKLRVCQVAAGAAEPLQIVCGAPNVRAGMKAPLARVGGRIGEMTLKQAKLRGVASHGMLCSARELGLSDEHQGLMALPADAPVGADLRDYLGLNDVSIEVDLTPNRGDCLGIEGLAREVGALTSTDVTAPEIEETPPAVADSLVVDVKEPQACPRYLGRVIRAVDTTAATPLWMQEKLRRSGLRSLGPVVDVTNYVLLELGQPMHAFDLARINGGIEVRYPRAGEQLVLLDDRCIEPGDDTLLICDQERPLALAGIMGGRDSAISADTCDLFLEVACFTPTAIAGKARAYGLNTDSAHRFERGVDPALQARAMARATELLLQIVGGRAGPVSEAFSEAHLPPRADIRLRRERIRRLLGFAPDDPAIVDMLTRLGADIRVDGQGWRVRPPSYRYDLAIEADLIEEVGRIFGYDNLPSANNRGALIMRPVPETKTPLQRVHSLLVDRGYQEAITYSFVDAAQQALIEPGLEPVALRNPISSELAVMRTSHWVGLIAAARHNLSRQQSRVRLFEQGLKYINQGNDLKQNNYLSGLLVGSRFPEQWGVDNTAVDFFDLKADVEAVLDCVGAGAVFQADTHPALHPGQCARIIIDSVARGRLGCIHPAVAQKLDISAQTYLFELDLQILDQRRVPSFQNLSRFPSIRRDLAIVVSAETPAGDLCDAITARAGDALKGLTVFDVYQGKGIETGRKSIAFGLILQDSSRTLTDEDVDRVMAAVTRQLEDQFGATLRE